MLLKSNVIPVYKKNAKLQKERKANDKSVRSTIGGGNQGHTAADKIQQHFDAVANFTKENQNMIEQMQALTTTISNLQTQVNNHSQT
jgi:hypothetical protein